MVAVSSQNRPSAMIPNRSCCAGRARPALTLAAVLCVAAALPSAGTAAPSSYTDAIPGTPLSFDMVFLAGGTVNIGSPETEAGRESDEGPAYDVVVKPFWIGRHEVTWDEYERFWLVEESSGGANGADAVTRPSAAYEPPDLGWGRGKRPAMHLTWHAATHYCEWLSLKTGHAYRLPTEAEWEFACRGGSTSRTFCGDDASALADHAWFKDNAGGKTQEAGRKKANPYGLHDMLGNVWEYCGNPYTTEYPLAEEAEGKKKKHKPALRGGSFQDPPEALRCANRQTVVPAWNARNPQRPVGPWWLTDGPMCGFRLARSADDESGAGKNTPKPQ